jgi:hypothetical protein
MAHIVTGPLTTNASISESGGRLSGLSVEYLVENLVGTGANRLHEALGASDIPRYGQAYDSDANLIVTSRQADLAGEDCPDKALVSISYSSVTASGYGFQWSGSASLSQTSIQFTPTQGELKVTHTWPDDDPDWPGEEKIQVAEAQVLQSQHALTGTGTIPLNNPHIKAQALLGAVNDGVWMGGEPETWMCMSVSHEPIDLTSSPNQHRFTIEMHWRPDTWLTEVTFIDPRTGRPPPDLIYNIGIIPVIWHPKIDFSDKALFYPGTVL